MSFDWTVSSRRSGVKVTRAGSFRRAHEEKPVMSISALSRPVAASGDQLGPVAAWRDVVGPFVFCPGAPHDEGAVGAVRVLVELVGAQVELGGKQIVHALARR